MRRGRGACLQGVELGESGGGWGVELAGDDAAGGRGRGGEEERDRVGADDEGGWGGCGGGSDQGASAGDEEGVVGEPALQGAVHEHPRRRRLRHRRFRSWTAAAGPRGGRRALTVDRTGRGVNGRLRSGPNCGQAVPTYDRCESDTAPSL